MISFILAGEMIHIISNVFSRNQEPIREVLPQFDELFCYRYLTLYISL